MLSDRTIRKLLDNGQLALDPAPLDECIQPASIDVRLGEHFIERGPQRDNPMQLRDGDSYVIRPGHTVLAHTEETITLPRDLVARVEGKSSWGRRFLMVHSTAGFIDPGFSGQITLELKNLGWTMLTLVVGEPIAQISFDWLDGPADRPYGSDGLNSHYQHQTGATGPRC